jgi:hypothetical protein
VGTRPGEVIVPGDSGVTRVTTGDPEDPVVLEQEIEATRAEMTETLDAIQSRLDPEVVSEQAKDVAKFAGDEAKDIAKYASEEAKEVVKFAIDEAKGAVRELADQATSSVRGATIGRVEKMMTQTRGSARQMSQSSGLMDTLKQNPVPAALAAIGIGWLLRNRGNGSGEVHYDYYSRRGAEMGRSSYPSYDYGTSGMSGYYGGGYSSGYAGDFSGMQGNQQGQSAGEHAQQMAGEMQERAGQMMGQVQHQAGQVQQQAQGLWHVAESNPIAMGAVGLLLGGVAGLLLPETRKERELLGEHRDQVIGNIQQVAGQTVEKVQRVAAEAAQEAMQTAKEEAKSEGLMPKDGGGSGASSSGSQGQMPKSGSGSGASSSM